MLEVQLRELKSTAELRSLAPRRQKADTTGSTGNERRLDTQEDIAADPLGVTAGRPLAPQPSEEAFALGFLNSGAGSRQDSALCQLSRICSDGLALWYAGPRQS